MSSQGGIRTDLPSSDRVLQVAVAHLVVSSVVGGVGGGGVWIFVVRHFSVHPHPNQITRVVERNATRLAPSLLCVCLEECESQEQMTTELSE